MANLLSKQLPLKERNDVGNKYCIANFGWKLMHTSLLLLMHSCKGVVLLRVLMYNCDK